MIARDPPSKLIYCTVASKASRNLLSTDLRKGPNGKSGIDIYTYNVQYLAQTENVVGRQHHLTESKC